MKLSSEIMYERILSGNVKHYSRCVPTSANALDQPFMVARVRLSYNKVLDNKFSLFKKCHTCLSSLFLLHCPLYISYKFGSHFVPIQVLWPSRGIRVVRHSICLTPQPIRLTSYQTSASNLSLQHHPWIKLQGHMLKKIINKKNWSSWLLNEFSLLVSQELFREQCGEYAYWFQCVIG